MFKTRWCFAARLEFRGSSEGAGGRGWVRNFQDDAGYAGQRSCSPVQTWRSNSWLRLCSSRAFSLPCSSWPIWPLSQLERTRVTTSGQLLPTLASAAMLVVGASCGNGLVSLSSPARSCSCSSTGVLEVFLQVLLEKKGGKTPLFFYRVQCRKGCCPAWLAG